MYKSVAEEESIAGFLSLRLIPYYWANLHLKRNVADVTTQQISPGREGSIAVVGSSCRVNN